MVRMRPPRHVHVAAAAREQREQLAAAHYDALEQLILSALTDTWSAIRKASARALRQPRLVPEHLRQLHSRFSRYA